VKNRFAWLIAAILAASFCFFFWALFSHEYNWSSMWPYAGNLLQGWGTTVWISLAALVVSTLMAAGLTVAKLSDVKPARWLANLYIELIRGTPLLVQLLIGTYMLAPQLHITNRAVVGVLILSAFAAAYLAEIFRGGIESIAKSQWDSARAIGFTERQTYRWVVIPQAVRRVLPATAGQFANLIKDSSLLYAISVTEFTAQARSANALTYSDFAAYVPLALGYLALTLPISLWSGRLERRFRYEH
jgi:polar amino acid transport system permease protein